MLSEKEQLKSQKFGGARIGSSKPRLETNFLEANKRQITMSPKERKESKKQFFRILKEKHHIVEDRKYMLDKANYQLKMLKANSAAIKKQITEKMYSVLRERQEDKTRVKSWISFVVISKYFLLVEKRISMVKDLYE